MVHTLKKDNSTLMVWRSYSVPPSEVFRAWTDPAIISTWLAPPPYRVQAINMHPQVGGTYRIEMVNPESGGRAIVSGTFEQLDPALIVFTWKWDTPDAWKVHTRVAIELKSTDTGTELVLTHGQLPTIKDRDDHLQNWTVSLNQMGDKI